MRVFSTIVGVSAFTALFSVCASVQAQSFSEIPPVYNSPMPTSGNGISYARDSSRPGFTLACDWFGEGATQTNYMGRTLYSGGGVSGSQSVSGVARYEWSGGGMISPGFTYTAKVNVTGSGQANSDGIGSSKTQCEINGPGMNGNGLNGALTITRETQSSNSYQYDAQASGSGSGTTVTYQQYSGGFTDGDILGLPIYIFVDGSAKAITGYTSSPGSAHSVGKGWTSGEVHATSL